MDGVFALQTVDPNLAPGNKGQGTPNQSEEILELKTRSELKKQQNFFFFFVGVGVRWGEGIFGRPKGHRGSPGITWNILSPPQMCAFRRWKK